VIVLPPEQLAISYIANSNILQFVSSLGVKLDLFYRLLWRHALVVEIIRRHSDLDSDVSTKNLFQRLRERFDVKRQANLKRALEYMETYTGRFWEDTERRIKEVTSKVEQDIKASISTGASFPVSFGLEGAKSLSTEQKDEVVHRAQNVVNKIQVRELSEMIALLDEILDDPQQQFYVVVDRLDEDWVDDRLRYGLIRALLETVREFHRVRNAKIIMALRLDLVDRVFIATRDAGFQQEKYEGELLRLQWTKTDLLDVLDRRVNHLVRRRYIGSATVSHRDLMPRKIGNQNTADFVIDRTLMRPRDIIQFFNACIQHADGKALITEKAVLEAEGEYSRSRLHALADEWYSDYPNLLRIVLALLRQRPTMFEVGSVSSKEIEDFCLDAIANGLFQHDDVISRDSLLVVEGKMTPTEHWYNAVEMFYRVGLVGVKTEPDQPLVWSVFGRRTISTAEIHAHSRVSVHRCFWRVLGIGDRKREATREA
jgi:hypothetical protein